MGANYNNVIAVSVSLDAPAISRAGFTTLLIASDSMSAGFTERTRSYTSAAAAAADGDLSATNVAMVSAAFAQTIKPSLVKVGRADFTVPASIATELDSMLAEDADWFGMCIESRGDAEILASASWCNINERLAIFQSSNAAMLAAAYVPGAGNLGDDLKDAGYRYAALLWHDLDAEYADVAWAGNRLSVDPDTSTTIWGLTTPQGITANNITDTEKANILSYNANTLLPYFGDKVFNPGVTFEGASGRKIDLVVTAAWTTARVSEALASLLLNTVNQGRKIPYTDAGFGALTSTTLRVLAQGVSAGHFIDGTQQVAMPALANIPPADRTAREINFTFGAEPAGAVESCIVQGYVSIDLTAVA